MASCVVVEPCHWRGQRANPPPGARVVAVRGEIVALGHPLHLGDAQLLDLVGRGPKIGDESWPRFLRKSLAAGSYAATGLRVTR
jgi:hypothetical protein